jgi:hypothetical protein
MRIPGEPRLLPFQETCIHMFTYPEAFSISQAERIVPKDCKLRRVKHLNSVIEQDHRLVKKRVRASQCFKALSHGGANSGGCRSREHDEEGAGQKISR